jgi:hypothetical protein
VAQEINDLSWDIMVEEELHGITLKLICPGGERKEALGGEETEGGTIGTYKTLGYLVWMIWFRTVCLAFSVLLFGACGATEQTPGDVGQKFEEGIKGNGTIVPEDKDRSQTGPSDNSPVTKPAGVPPS